MRASIMFGFVRFDTELEVFELADIILIGAS